jgi:hypothetical protein
MPLQERFPATGHNIFGHSSTGCPQKNLISRVNLHEAVFAAPRPNTRQLSPTPFNARFP